MRSNNSRTNRRKRIRKKISGSAKKPRLSVFRSNRNIYIQAIDDVKGETIASMSNVQLKSGEQKGSKTEVSEKVGEKLGEILKKKKITDAVFDRGGYQYFGRVKALAEGIRKAGIKF